MFRFGAANFELPISEANSELPILEELWYRNIEYKCTLCINLVSRINPSKMAQLQEIYLYRAKICMLLYSNHGP